MASSNKVLTQVDMLKILDAIYDKAIKGVGRVSPSIEEFAEEYKKKESNREKAAQNMIKNQILKCTTSGFITGFGGVITLPISIPANITSVLYVQMRMIACCAYLAGYDTASDQVQSLVYACLAGISVNSLIKNVGIKLGEKLATSMIKKIPGKALTKINQKVSFRFVTKFGEKGILNLGKMTPGVGAVIGGAFDFAETKAIANRAYKWFFEGDMTGDEKNLPVFLWHSKCSTCKKAKAWLEQNNIEFKERNIVEKKPSKKEIKQWIKMADVDIKKWFNTSGMLYKELKLKDKLEIMTLEEKIDLLASDGMLVKRPLFISQENIMIGFKEEEWKNSLL